MRESDSEENLDDSDKDEGECWVSKVFVICVNTGNCLTPAGA